jgi:hypothetical protein
MKADTAHMNILSNPFGQLRSDTFQAVLVSMNSDQANPDNGQAGTAHKEDSQSCFDMFRPGKHNTSIDQYRLGKDRRNTLCTKISPQSLDKSPIHKDHKRSFPDELGMTQVNTRGRMFVRKNSGKGQVRRTCKASWQDMADTFQDCMRNNTKNLSSFGTTQIRTESTAMNQLSFENDQRDRHRKTSGQGVTGQNRAHILCKKWSLIHPRASQWNTIRNQTRHSRVCNAHTHREDTQVVQSYPDTSQGYKSDKHSNL